MATEGEVEIIATGIDGAPFEAAFHGVQLKHVNVTQDNFGNLNVEMIEDDITWCLDEFEVNTVLREPPAEIGQQFRDFQLQNCETGEFVNVHEEAQGHDAVWILGTAGWCPACKTMLFHGSSPRGVGLSMFQAVVDNPRLKGMIILGENSSRTQATLSYCRRHAQYYREGWATENPGVELPYSIEDASMFYLDHDGVRSFDQLFGSLKTYTNEDGVFGLPWNAVLEPGDAPIYRYADGSGQTENLGQMIQELTGVDVSGSAD
jgi:thiol-disulfide isomerase/thioredoxin